MVQLFWGRKVVGIGKALWLARLPLARVGLWFDSRQAPSLSHSDEDNREVSLFPSALTESSQPTNSIKKPPKIYKNNNKQFPPPAPYPFFRRFPVQMFADDIVDGFLLC